MDHIYGAIMCSLVLQSLFCFVHTEKRRSYRFGNTTVFFFWWNIPFNLEYFFMFYRLTMIHYVRNSTSSHAWVTKRIHRGKNVIWVWGIIRALTLSSLIGKRDEFMHISKVPLSHSLTQWCDLYKMPHYTLIVRLFKHQRNQTSKPQQNRQAKHTTLTICFLK